MLTLGSYPGENQKLRLRGSILIPAVTQLGKLSLNKMVSLSWLCGSVRRVLAWHALSPGFVEAGV